MSLEEQLNGDLRNAQKAGEADKVGVLRFVVAQIKNKEIEKRGQGKDPMLTNEEAMEVLQREVKKRREAIDLYEKGGRADLAEKEQQEMEIIATYLPKQLSREEIEAVVDTLIANSKEFNIVIREAMKELKGRADGRVVTEIIKAKLTQ